MHCQTWNELESELNSEFQYNHGVIEEVLLASENNAINANDYFWHVTSDQEGLQDSSQQDSEFYTEQQNLNISHDQLLA